MSNELKDALNTIMDLKEKLKYEEEKRKLAEDKLEQLYVDKKGNVARAKMARGKKKGKAKIQVVAKVGVKKQKGMLYFIDKQGDVSCAVMARGGRKKKASKKKR